MTNETAQRVDYPYCWCINDGTYLVPVDPEVTIPNAVMSDGEPAVVVCATHVDRDGFESITLGALAACFADAEARLGRGQA